MRVMGSSQRLKCEHRIEQLAVLLLKGSNVDDGNAWRGLLAEEQLQQELVPRRIVAKGHGEPLLQGIASCRSDRVRAAGSVARVRRICRDQAFSKKTLKRG